ncbi:PQQ-binding-like beta-propeller repeat protein [Haloarcula marina]|uniref:outer membrane protein assembly factor BamB family protein n=1 Tax=Haloarcula marina TaxID=2961574 RepID=UPI0020B75349|nr:PQQ-binding-like beta-propeller repeat protein [Halomicroarcula marina]
MQNTGQTDAAGPSGCVETRWTWTQERRLFGTPVIDKGSAYVPHSVIDDVSFVVLAAETGDEQWHYDGFPLTPRRTPTLVDDTLYLVSYSAIDAVDVHAQTSRWHIPFHLEGELSHIEGLQPPRVANGVVYLAADPGAVLALDADTGALRWIHDIEGLPPTVRIEGDSDEHAAVRRQGKPFAPVAVTDQRVYVSSWDLSLYALTAETGEREWAFSPGMDHLDMLHAPTVVDGAVYTQTEDAVLYVLDTETGDLLWTYDEYGESSDGVSPVVDEESVYIIAGTSTENLFLVALNQADGTVQWERPVGPPFQDPVADENTIYLDQGRNVDAIEKATGELKWELRMKSALAAPATIVDSAIFVADTAGSVYGVW